MATPKRSRAAAPVATATSPAAATAAPASRVATASPAATAARAATASSAATAASTASASPAASAAAAPASSGARRQKPGLYPNRPGFRPDRPVAIGGVVAAGEPIVYNLGRRTARLKVRNTGDRPIQVGSHFHFFEVNRYLSFDRDAAFGCHLDIPATTAIRFEPGDEKEVDVVAYAGKRRVIGFNGLVMGYTGDEDAPSYYPARMKAFRAVREAGFKLESGAGPSAEAGAKAETEAGAKSEAAPGANSDPEPAAATAAAVPAAVASNAAASNAAAPDAAPKPRRGRKPKNS